MKHISGIVLGVFVFFSLATGASAHTPTASITTVNGISAAGGFVALRIPYLPYTVPVGGIVRHADPGTITSTWLSLSDNFFDFLEPQHYFVGAGNSPEGAFTVPWTIDVAGMHFLQARATHGNRHNGDNPASFMRAALSDGFGIHIEVGQ